MRILAFAYACEPREGSEPGAGWIWSRMLARFGDVWVITRANNREAIEAGLDVPERNRLHFEYVDLPAWARFWKRGQRGIRAYYMLWQFAALRRGRRLQRQVGFDVVWHLTLSNAWLGSAAPLVGPPFIYGPVGGGVKVPWRLLPALGSRGAVYEAVRAVGRGTGRFLNPLARMAWRRAELILVQNRETRDWLPAGHREKVEVLPHVVLEEAPAADPGRRQRPESPTALFAARLLAWKGGWLALRAMARLPEWELLVAGSGPDEGRLRRLARRWGVESRVAFLGKLPRGELMEYMRTGTDVLLHPSMREDAGWVIGEALNRGIPVVCLDHGGPPLLGGSAVPVQGLSRTVDGLVRALRGAQRLSRAAPGWSVHSASSRLGDILRTWSESPAARPSAKFPLSAPAADGQLSGEKPR